MRKLLKKHIIDEDPKANRNVKLHVWRLLLFKSIKITL